jgi:RecA-family ATPase
LSHEIKKFGQVLDLSKEGHIACPVCRKKGRDNAGDNLVVYGLDSSGRHKGCRCFSCEWSYPSVEWMEQNGGYEEREEEISVVGKLFNEKIHNQLKEETGVKTKGYRGIRDETSQKFMMRYRYSEEDGTVAESYYPCTKLLKLSGYRIRKHPKEFLNPFGETGLSCDLFGQIWFKTFNHTVLITGGEHDAMAAYQMLSDAQKNKAFDPVAVVSGTCGEGSVHKQIQGQYEFFNQFKKIVICMDNDEAGNKAVEKIVKVLPRGKVFVMKMRKKDPNSYIYDNASGRAVKAEQDFINDYWSAQPHTPAGIYASTALKQAAMDRADLPIISLPECFAGVSAKSGGGIVKQEIFLMLAKTSIGKTTAMSALTEHMALHEPEEVVGVLSLEQDHGKFSLNLLSYHLGQALHRMGKDERQAYISANDAKIDKLYMRPDGSPTLYVCDDRGASWDQIKEKILEMIIGQGVTLLIVDPYSDLLSGMSVSEQEDVATWFKKIIKEYGITLIIVSHVRKTSNGGKDSPLTEDDAQGSSFLVKASGLTVSLERDKQSPSPILRNKTTTNILKNRDFSETGPAGAMFYDIPTARLHDFDTYMDANPHLAALLEEEAG